MASLALASSALYMAVMASDSLSLVFPSTRNLFTLPMALVKLTLMNSKVFGFNVVFDATDTLCLLPDVVELPEVELPAGNGLAVLCLDPLGVVHALVPAGVVLAELPGVVHELVPAGVVLAGLGFLVSSVIMWIRGVLCLLMTREAFPPWYR